MRLSALSSTYRCRRPNTLHACPATNSRRLLELALPLTISQFFTFALGIISVAFIGRLGEEQMAVAVLATSFSNVTGFSVVLGLLGALDTLCGQGAGGPRGLAGWAWRRRCVLLTCGRAGNRPCAYATPLALCHLPRDPSPSLLPPSPAPAPHPLTAWGAKQYRRLGIHLQKALITTLATCVAISLLWAHVEPLMLAVGQHEVIAAGAARYLLLSIPALLAAGMFE